MLIIFGLFRKCVVADNCALLANAAFSGRLHAPNLPVIAIGSYAFAWQIYGDFSGYSDIARGSAKLLGFHFMVNFRQPYLATSLQDFWRRWHISLSTWLRDYVYIPLGGSRHGGTQTYRNLLVTMLVGGLWHGANWTFVVWGGIHGAILAAERAARKLFGIEHEHGGTPDLTPERTLSIGSWVRRITIFHVVCLAWIFFRAQSLGEAVRFLSGVGSFAWRAEYGIAVKFLAFFVIPLFCIDLINEHRNEEYLFERLPERRRIATAAVVFLGIACFTGNNLNAFFYFQF
jgi:D-alanyl-lipoteichoic acid acyltransferase DltB (MBOAT superfamily)